MPIYAQNNICIFGIFSSKLVQIFDLKMPYYLIFDEESKFFIYFYIKTIILRISKNGQIWSNLLTL